MYPSLSSDGLPAHTTPRKMITPDDESPKTPEAPVGQPSTPVMSRHLQRFGSPDLEVAVGKNERLYHYHSLILASQSLYIDTLLSSPAAKQEQEKWRITFPDIGVETWEKMIKFLSPGADHPQREDMLEIVPFYDKYQFHVGLSYCDELLSKWIPSDEDEEYTLVMSGRYSDEVVKELCQIVSIIWPLNDFPRSKTLAVKWASRCLRKFYHVDAEMIELLMPLVENNDKVIKFMVSTFLGRKCKGMTMNEMRDLMKQPDFPEECILRCNHIKEIDEQRRHLDVKTLKINNCHTHEEVNGQYKFQRTSRFRQEYGSRILVPHKGGAMVGYWRKMKHTDMLYGAFADENIVVESLDVFGSGWEIYARPPRDDEGDDESRASEDESGYENRRILFRWENDICNSLIPPKRGWRIIDHSGNAVATNEASIEYSIEMDPGHY